MAGKRGDRKKKVLMVVPLPPPVHGASLISLQLVRSAQINHDFAVRVIPLKFAPSLNSLGKFSILKTFQAFLVSFRIVKELIFVRPDLVYSVVTPNGFSHYRDLLWAVIFRLFRLRRLCQVRELGFSEGGGRFFRWRMGQLFKNAHVSVLSPLVRSDVSGWVGEERIHVIPNGLPDEKPLPGIVNNKHLRVPRILFLSNFMKMKGVYILLDAIRLLLDRGIDFHLTMAGDFGRDISAKELEDRIQLLGVAGRVSVSGPVDGEKKRKLLNYSDMLVFPTLREAFGNVLLEAMRAGLPIVASRVDSIPWIMPHEACGLLFRAGDPGDLAEKLETLLMDPEKRARMGLTGRERFEKMFTADVFEKRMAEVMTLVASGER